MRWMPHSRRRWSTKSETCSAMWSAYPLRRAPISGVQVDELEGAPPGVVGCPLELRLLPVEEAVRRTHVLDELVLDAGLVEGLVEGGVVLVRDVGIGAALEREQRAAEPGHLLEGRPPIEPHRAGKPVSGSGGEPGGAAAEAEADGEDARRPAVAEVSDAGGDVGLDPLGRRLLAMRRVIEVLAPLLRAGRAPVVVEGDRGVAALGEAESELLVEPVEAADVREDHDPGCRRPVGEGGEGGEAIPVRRLEHEVVVGDSRPGDRRDRRQGVGVEAHAAGSYEAAAY